jgi:hypothetical protein
MALLQAFATALAADQLKATSRQGASSALTTGGLFGPSPGGVERAEALPFDPRTLNSRSLATMKPVLQLNAFPVALSAHTYANALSTDNPNGSLAALWAFRQLIDPVPDMSQYYAASTGSTESVYRLIAQGAAVAGSSPPATFATQVILDAQKQIAAAKGYANMDGTVGSWLPVQAVPEDWCSALNNYSNLTVDLAADQLDANSSSGPYTVLGSSADNLQWHLGAGSALRAQALSPSSLPSSVQMKYLMVSLTRPWFNPVLFKTLGWELPGQSPGFCSSGTAQNNPGVLPIVPTGLILGTQIQINASTWGAPDQQLIQAAQAGGPPLALGPFPVLPKAAPPTVHVIGWISSITPLSPTGNG